MAVLSTNLLAVRTRELADMIETLPVSVAPEHQYDRCCELLEQVAIEVVWFFWTGPIVNL